MAMERDWSSLPSDILFEFLDRLSFPSNVAFSYVCTSWRALCPRKPRYHNLIVARRDEDEEDTITGARNMPYTKLGLLNFCVGSNFDDEITCIDLPDTCKDKPFQVCGSSYGWIALQNQQSITIFNPVTRSHEIELPKFFDDCVNLTDHPIRIIFSSQPCTKDCVFLGFCLDSFRLEILKFCRRGDAAWTIVHYPHNHTVIRDAVFYKGRFYLVSAYSLLVCDLENQNPRAIVIQMNNPRYGTIFQDKLTVVLSRWQHWNSYFVVSTTGDLLTINSFSFKIDDETSFRAEMFKVEFDEEEEERSESVKLVDLLSLKDEVLFLSSEGQCLSLSEGHFPDCCRGGFIYLVRNHECQPQHPLISVIDLKTMALQFVTAPLASAASSWESCSWFTPTKIF